MSEDELGPVSDKVKEDLLSADAANIKIEDLGKSRLAYPMKHIRYGYFRLCQFEAEPAAIPVIEAKLRLVGQLLRAIIRKSNKDNKFVLDKISAISDVTLRDNVPASPAAESTRTPVAKKEEVVEETARKLDAPVKEAIPKPMVETKTETKAENVKLDEIDKKLDELLETNIADV